MRSGAYAGQNNDHVFSSHLFSLPCEISYSERAIRPDLTEECRSYLHLPVLFGKYFFPVEALAAHTIPFSGLKDGTHDFDFVLGDDFLRNTGVEEFLGGELKAHVTLEKSEHLLVTLIDVDGHIDMLCDHCNAPMQQPVKGEQRQIFKLTGEDETDDDELVSIDPHANEINLTHYIFECISLHLPIRHVHPPGECDPEVEGALEKVQVHEPVPDPRWAVLKDLKNKSV